MTSFFFLGVAPDSYNLVTKKYEVIYYIYI